MINFLAHAGHSHEPVETTSFLDKVIDALTSPAMLAVLITLGFFITLLIVLTSLKTDNAGKDKKS